MSFITTMTLRKAGRLNEALQQATADWQQEKSPQACMAMYGGYFETAKISLKSSILQLAEIQVVK